jgi:hypothetical protein
MTLTRTPRTSSRRSSRPASRRPTSCRHRFSPDKMLLGRVFSYADAHRARIRHELRPAARQTGRSSRRTRTTRTARHDLHHTGAAAVYAPTAWPGRTRTFEGRVDDGWEADGEMVRQRTSSPLPEDDDFGQAGTLVREVFDQDQRDRLVDTQSPPSCATASPSRSSSAPSGTGSRSTPRSAPPSRRGSAPERTAPQPPASTPRSPGPRPRTPSSRRTPTPRLRTREGFHPDGWGPCRVPGANLTR